LAFVALLAAALYTIRVNPEIRVYRQAIHVKRSWAGRLAADPAPRFILAGGSSAAFSVDGESLLRDHGVRLVNFGLHAGMGPLFVTAVAAREARPSDTFLLALEPGLLTEPFSSPDLGAQIGWALGEQELIRASPITGERVHWMEDLLSLRPGAFQVFNVLGAVVVRKRIYRYSIRDFNESGWQRAHDFREFGPPSLPSQPLSGDALRLLDALAQWGQTNRVNLMYSLPWAYVPPDQAEPFRRVNAAFLAQVRQKMPVLKDLALGVHSIRSHFADTAWHLTPEAARLRTENLAASLKSAAAWSRDELELLAREQPQNP